MFESQLFGHKAGAFTDAKENFVGKIAKAYGGLLFLDEIGDMPLNIQGKFLSFLDSREIQPIGVAGRWFIPVLVVAATNRDLKLMIKQGKFRNDLYQRFTKKIKILPLNERKDELEYIIDYLLQRDDINPHKDTSKERIIEKVEAIVFEVLRYVDFSHGNFRFMESIIRSAVNEAKKENNSILLLRHLRKVLIDVGFEYLK